MSTLHYSTPRPTAPAAPASFQCSAASKSSHSIRFPPRTLLLITAIFWTFVTLTNVLYGFSMQINADQVAKAMLFAPWNVRVLQHALLFPVLFGCFSLSTRVGWTPMRRAPIQVTLGVAFASLSFFAMRLAEVIYARAMQETEWSPGSHPEAVGALWTASFATFFLTYGFGIALVTGFALYRRFRDAELRNAALEQGWNKARLAALRMQLSPHTLFNLLHTIDGHINQEPRVAKSMVVQLAALLRRLLSASQRDFCTLREELDFVRLYLELQQQRFSDRLTFQLPAAGDHGDIWVPSLILQPLVENAVVHGLADHDAPVLVDVALQRSSKWLTLQVTNTVALGHVTSREGIGLSNVRERLFVQFEQEASLVAKPNAAGDWAAVLTMPILQELSSRSALDELEELPWTS